VRQRSQHGANNEGVLFPNDRKQSDKSPDFRGQANIDSVSYWVSAWKRTSRDGQTKYLSIAFTPKVPTNVKDAFAHADEQVVQDNDLNDDIPW
jgi:uncharacterized protein (DUF736 family)